LEVWKDGSSIWSKTGVSSLSGINQLYAGVRAGYRGTYHVYFDCVVVADTYIGLISEGETYIVDLNWQSNPSYTVDKKANFSVNPSWNFVSAFNLVKQSIFNVVFQWQTVTSWNLIVNHILGAIQYIVDLSWQTISNWNKILKSTYSLIIPWETSVEWNIIHELTYIVNLGWQTSTSWLLDIYYWVSTGITQFVDLSWETISNWTMEVASFILEITNIEVLALAALAFVIGIIALAIAIVNIKNE